jgi:hypothetical protein
MVENNELHRVCIAEPRKWALIPRRFQGLDGMFKTRFGGNAFFYFVKSVTDTLRSFGKLDNYSHYCDSSCRSLPAETNIFNYGFITKLGL